MATLREIRLVEMTSPKDAINKEAPKNITKRLLPKEYGKDNEVSNARR